MLQLGLNGFLQKPQYINSVLQWLDMFLKQNLVLELFAKQTQIIATVGVQIHPLQVKGQNFNHLF